jgi:hypothetical protein
MDPTNSTVRRLGCIQFYSSITRKQHASIRHKTVIQMVTYTRYEAKMDEALDERCSCGEIETQDHMWTCKEMRPKRINFLAELDCWATKHHTHEPLQRSILESFTKWANRSQSGLLAKEYKIGMEKVMRGYIPAYWGQSQETHRQSIQINTTGAIWANFCGRFNITIGKTAAKPNTSRQLTTTTHKTEHSRGKICKQKSHTLYQLKDHLQLGDQ